MDVSDTLSSMDRLTEIVVRSGQRSFACLALAAFDDSATFQRSCLMLGLMCEESMIGNLDSDFGPSQTLALVPWLVALAQLETRLERSSNRRIGWVVVDSLADIWTLTGTDVYCCSTCFHSMRPDLPDMDLAVCIAGDLDSVPSEVEDEVPTIRKTIVPIGRIEGGAKAKMALC